MSLSRNDVHRIAEQPGRWSPVAPQNVLAKAPQAVKSMTRVVVPKSCSQSRSNESPLKPPQACALQDHNTAFSPALWAVKSMTGAADLSRHVWYTTKTDKELSLQQGNMTEPPPPPPKRCNSWNTQLKTHPKAELRRRNKQSLRQAQAKDQTQARAVAQT